MKIEQHLQCRLPYVRKLSRARLESGGYIVEILATHLHRGSRYADWLPVFAERFTREYPVTRAVLLCHSFSWQSHVERKRADRLVRHCVLDERLSQNPRLTPMDGIWPAWAWHLYRHSTLVQFCHVLTHGDSDEKWSA